MKGADGGCFKAALTDARRWGGVIEHPWGCHAWPHFGLNVPPRSGGWIAADFHGGWTCCVEQGRYVGTLRAGALNIFNRKNLFYFDLFTLQRVDQLPFIPSVGMKVELR